ncbi:60S ribosomal protein L31 [Trebouxia sp. C0009 RCD-2024]
MWLPRNLERQSVTWETIAARRLPLPIWHSRASSIKMVDKKSRVKDAVTREYTINLHKRLHKITFKKRAPKAIKEIKKFASKHMRTSDVRVDVKLNKAVWSRGIRNVPTKLRIQISRKRNDDEDAKEDMYSYVTVADDQQFKGKNTEVVDA